MQRVVVVVAGIQPAELVDAVLQFRRQPIRELREKDNACAVFKRRFLGRSRRFLATQFRVQDVGFRV